MKKTVLILGAGASRDYGYPLWSELRSQLLSLDLDAVGKELGLTSDDLLKHREVFDEFKSKVKEYPEATLDQIIWQIDVPKAQHLNCRSSDLI